MDMTIKYQTLKDHLRICESAVVAYSGGVDSSLLLKAAVDQLGPDRVLAVTVHSPLVPEAEIETARRVATVIGAAHQIIAGDELTHEALISNQPDRCFHCKRSKLARLRALADEGGYKYVLEGSNQSDTGDYRPGMAALSEHPWIKSPLLELGLGKEEIRALARAQGLPNWNKPSQACLASRIPYGTRISEQVVRQVGSVESALGDMGFEDVRVRHHGDIARLEIAPHQFYRITDEGLRRQILEIAAGAGFRYVALDLAGYRTGSLNPALSD